MLENEFKSVLNNIHCLKHSTISEQIHSTLYWKLGSLVRGISFTITVVIEMSCFVQVYNPRYIVPWLKGSVIMLICGSI